MRRLWGIVIVGLCLLCAAGASAAPPELLARTPEDSVAGSSAGRMLGPGGVAASPILPGDLYVADIENERVDQFSPFGEFIRAWGWGVEDGSPELQRCTDFTGCSVGLIGSGAGQFDGPGAVAVDGSGNVYVVEGPNHRVQKFDQEGNFILTFGANVNSTKVGEGGASQTEKDVCTAVSEDVCQAGSPGTGGGELSAPFYSWRLAVDRTSGDVFVAEGERIQKFGPAGNYIESIALPSGQEAGSLATDSGGDLYLAYAGGTEVLKVKPEGPSAQFLQPTFDANRPLGGGLTVASDGRVYVPVLARTVPQPAGTPESILEFGPSGGCLNCGENGEGGKEGFDRSADQTGIRAVAAGSACGSSDVYTAHRAVTTNPNLSYLNVFGEAPDTTLCPPPKRAPEIHSQFGIAIGSREARLGAQINPKFWNDTTYAVEYGTGPCSLGGCQSVPVPPALLSAKAIGNFVTGSATLSGLVPETTYHYRFVTRSTGSEGQSVKGAGGTVATPGTEGTFTTFADVLRGPACANDAFRSGLSEPLPDCRAYEMVSPVNKEGGDIAPGASASFRYISQNATLAEAAADGEQATYSSLRAFGEPQAAPFFNQFLSVRGPGGWTATSISPPRTNLPIYGPSASVQYKSFSEDLCTSWLMQDADVQLAPGAPAGVAGIYRRDDCASPPAYTSLSNVFPPGFATGELERIYYLPVPQGHSADGTKSFFRATSKLTPNACEEPGIFQVYVASEGPLRLVSIRPSGVATCDYSYLGTQESPGGDTFREASVYHAVSDDGERVYWTDSGSSAVDLAGGGKTGPATLYLRVNATQAQSAIGGVSGEDCTQAARACTFPVSAGGEARFWAATPDGSKAIYTEGGNLFSYSLATKSSTPIAAGVTGVAGASEDLSRIYLISTEKLSGPQKNSVGREAVAGKANLYLEQGGSFTFVATLSTEEGLANTGNGQPSSPANVRPFLRTSRLTSDGLHLAFTSSEPLTGYDNADRGSGEADAELFLYDAGAGAGSLRCVSCNPTGSRPTGREISKANNGAISLWASGQLPGWAEQDKPTRLLTSDGSRLYFESFDALVPRDSNGVRDVYQWERAGSRAECQQKGDEIFAPAAGGCLSLVSSGTGEKNSELIDASAGGRDVFFATEASLLPQDPGNFDIYDAREGGGFPPPSKPAPCEGEGCRAKATPPGQQNPGSGTSGPGNPKKCAKGTHRVMKKGKTSCIKNKRKHHKKSKKNKGKKTDKSGGQGR